MMRERALGIGVLGVGETASTSGLRSVFPATLPAETIIKSRPE